MPYKAKTPKSLEPCAIVFPIYGCDPTRGHSREEMEAQSRTRCATLKKHWDHEGVKAVIELIEIQGALCQRRAIDRDATLHDAGQAFALGELLALLQRHRLT